MQQIEIRLRQLLLAVMQPIASVVLRANVRAVEFIDIVKAAFVFSATKEYGRNGKEASVSHVSRITGLTRKEIARLKAKFDYGGNAKFVSHVDAPNVLSYWHTDSEFLDESGYPKILRRGPGEGTFFELAKRYAPKTDSETIIQSLLAGNCVDELPDGKLKPLSRNTSMSKGVEGAIAVIDTGLRCLAHTAAHNLVNDKGKTWLQRTVSSEDINPVQLAYLRRTIRDRASDFCVGIDDLMNASAAAGRDVPGA